MPLLFFVFTAFAGIVCAILGFVWRVDDDVDLLLATNSSNSTNSTGAAIMEEERVYVPMHARFFVHAMAAVFMGTANSFLHSSGVEIMKIFLPQDIFFSAVSLGYGVKRMVTLTLTLNLTLTLTLILTLTLTITTI